ncbi:MAG TPA: AAA family ATPase [Gemmataceae bacterium]|nr:AAA family ATPase [Gemmataceae bacterium]
MKPIAFRIEMYKSVIDSGWVDVVPLTVIVGKNESGKTTLLKALHKFKPFREERYNINREWPRGRRREQTDKQTVCTVRFELGDDELTALGEITDQRVRARQVEVAKNYSGQFQVMLDIHQFPDRPHRDATDTVMAQVPEPPSAAGDAFRQVAEACLKEAQRTATEGEFAGLGELAKAQADRMRAAFFADAASPQRQQEDAYVNAYTGKLRDAMVRLRATPTICQKATEYILHRIPTFIYMDEYRTFKGTTWLNELKMRQKESRLAEEDRTFLMILGLSGLDLESLIQKGQSKDREERQYDLSDAGATLTQDIAARWRQRRYEVNFRADGDQFMTFVSDDRDRTLIPLEDRSKGFQWFFSFDLLFMHETDGTFKDCLILLDEPGLHLHPDAQQDLLARLEAYATGNTLIDTTHLPFMIDLTKPDRIRVISETANGTVVHSDLTQSQPEAKLVLQAALGMSGRTSFLLSPLNLVVEGVDDYWIVTELSNLLRRSGEPALPEELFITPAGGASEAGYIATLMIGQKLGVVVLLDFDKSGNDARDKLVKNWLTRYQANSAQVLTVGECVGVTDRDFAIEDLFPEDFYVALVEDVYKRQLQAAGVTTFTLPPGGLLCKRVERGLEAHGIPFNKGSVAKVLRSKLSHAESLDALPEETRDLARKLIGGIVKALPGHAPVKSERGGAKPARSRKKESK